MRPTKQMSDMATGPVVEIVTMKPAQVGDRVDRIVDPDQAPRLGTIIETDETRIRVQWDGSLRRWLRRDTEGKSWRRVAGG